MAVESKLDGVSLIASYRVEPQAHCPNALTQGTTVRIEVPMVRSDATTSTLLDTTKPRRSFYLQGFTHAERPESKQTHQIMIDYLEDQGLDAVGQSTEADILVVREGVSAMADHVMLGGFKGSEIWIINSNARLHREYNRYQHQRLRHVPLPVMLSAVAKWLAKSDNSVKKIPNVASTNEPVDKGSEQQPGEDRSESGDSLRIPTRPWVLVVDDNVINRKILVRNMKGMVSRT